MHCNINTYENRRYKTRVRGCNIKIIRSQNIFSRRNFGYNFSESASISVLDLGKDGHIPAEQLEHALSRTGDRFTEQKIKEIIRKADSNKDGKTDYIDLHEKRYNKKKLTQINIKQDKKQIQIVCSQEQQKLLQK